MDFEGFVSAVEFLSYYIANAIVSFKTEVVYSDFCIKVEQGSNWMRDAAWVWHMMWYVWPLSFTTPERVLNWVDYFVILCVFLIELFCHFSVTLLQAKGMNYLHNHNPLIVHRDLKSPNLLVDKKYTVKVWIWITKLFCSVSWICFCIYHFSCGTSVEFFYVKSFYRHCKNKLVCCNPWKPWPPSIVWKSISLAKHYFF